ncbi:hypothetical protein ORV05_25135 [Amycolatopsis cynarae]|uniref:DUF3137 domain-containing protein n=1 Tax=Amycolatopsis cynarae TaxID=2995223 RepID=A0ABY7AWZ0_9PSEU|nr:hypothetical protein [Amycolatopsis sp. HUAS 11-8]WAL64242.1 hypothetical protein ORV05_25135 [Amycolatopsis sp. HUAS 11-8]
MSAGAVIAIAVGGTLLMAAGITWMVLAINRSNGRDEQAILARLRDELPKRGWIYEERNDSYADVFNAQPAFKLRNPLEPLVAPPEALGARHVITGVHRGRPFLIAEFDVRHKGQRFPTGAVWMRLPEGRPPLTVRQVIRAQSRIRSAIGQRDMQLGHPGFDERFEITTESEPFARAVLTPQVVNFLMNAPRQVTGFAVYGDHFDLHDIIDDHRDPAELVPALDLRCDLLDLIPASVWA